MTFIHKLINAAANRISLGPRNKRELVDTVLRKLPEATYWRLREQGFAPGGIVDIGAHEGYWTRLIRGVFPTPPILMIEARNEQEPALKQVCIDLPQVEYTISLLGRGSRTSASFHVSGTGSSIFPERSDTTQILRLIPMRTLDDTLSESSVTEPLFLKLDIQGAELECLRGGMTTLQKSEVVQLEVALLNYNEGAPQVVEVISFMDGNEFAIFDIAGFVRPNGINLVQLDIIFVKKDSSLRPNFIHFPH